MTVKITGFADEIAPELTAQIDPCRMGHHHGRQTHRTGGRAESGGYLCFKETVMA